MSHDLRALEARLETLERDNRRLRRALGLVAALFAIPLLAAYVPANDRIEASEFVVKDKGGAVRARLFLDETGKTKLVLRDKDGRSTATLTSGDGASLSLGDKDGKASVVVSASEKGVMVLESEGKPKAVLPPPKGWEAKDGLDVQDPWATPE